jgi:hypothetical protein
MARPYEHGNKTLGSIKEGKFTDQLSDCQLLKKNSSMELGDFYNIPYRS